MLAILKIFHCLFEQQSRQSVQCVFNEFLRGELSYLCDHHGKRSRPGTVTWAPNLVPRTRFSGHYKLYLRSSSHNILLLTNITHIRAQQFLSTISWISELSINIYPPIFLGNVPQNLVLGPKGVLYLKKILIVFLMLEKHDGRLLFFRNAKLTFIFLAHMETVFRFDTGCHLMEVRYKRFNPTLIKCNI